jgi:hypothetical protein
MLPPPDRNQAVEFVAIVVALLLAFELPFGQPVGDLLDQVEHLQVAFRGGKFNLFHTFFEGSERRSARFMFARWNVS